MNMEEFYKENYLKELRDNFSNAPQDAMIDRVTAAAVVGRSPQWMVVRALAGEGVPFVKKANRYQYRKLDILEWLEDELNRRGKRAFDRGHPMFRMGRHIYLRMIPYITPEAIKDNLYIDKFPEKKEEV